MSAGLAQLDDIIGRVKGVEQLGAETAREAAPLVEAALKKTAAAGQNPDGTPWPQRKNGGRAYANAAEHIHVKSLDNIVNVTLDGIGEVFGRLGVRGMPVRAAIPIVGEELPRPVAAACAEGARRAFDKIMGGSR